MKERGTPSSAPANREELKVFISSRKLPEGRKTSSSRSAQARHRAPLSGTCGADPARPRALRSIAGGPPVGAVTASAWLKKATRDPKPADATASGNMNKARKQEGQSS